MFFSFFGVSSIEVGLCIMIYTWIYRWICMPKGLPKVFKGFRFTTNLYLNFKELTAKKGYTVTETFETFMSKSLEYGLAFPSAVKTENVEAEARIMLAWLQQGQCWVSLGDKEDTSTRGRLLSLLPNVEDASLRIEIEENLKKKTT